MLTRFKPIKATIIGTLDEDLYIAVGEPIGVRNICSVICKMLKRDELQPLQTIEVTMDVKEI